jgi:iron(III) transport system substrate-binding protein
MARPWSVLTLLVALVIVSAGDGMAAGGSPAAARLDPELQKVYRDAVEVIPNLDPAILAGAKSEGHLTLYRLTFEVEGLFPAFNKLFPFVRITDFKASGAPLLAKYTAEARSGRSSADVVQSTEPAATDKIDGEGLVTHYTITADAAFAGQYKRSGVYYSYGVVALCSAYNPDMVTEDEARVLSTWEGMLDPRWKGKAGTVLFGNGGSTALAYYFLWHEKGPEFWNRFFAQQPLVFSGAALGAERLAAGGISVHFFANEGNFYDQMKKGAPIRWRLPEPTLANNAIQFIAKNPAHPNAARLWQEWLMSKQGQKLWMQQSSHLTARTDVADERPVTKLGWYSPPKTLYKYSWDQIFKSFPLVKEQWDRSASAMKKGG